MRDPANSRESGVISIVDRLNDAKRFCVPEGFYTYAEMLAANASDPDVCAWLITAKVGDYYPAFVTCQRVA